MYWVTKTFTTSIGKKILMAVTGLSFCCFLTVHLIGNLTLYGGQDLFNAYVEHLHSLGPVITLFEWGLLLLAIIHILTGSILFFQNLKARPVRYKVNKNAGGRTLGSATMPYTGFILLLFIIFHLFDFHFVDHTDQTVYQIVSNSLSQIGLATVYLVAVIIAAVHISHGFWSLFQTLGANHPKYMSTIKNIGILFSLIIGIGFGFIPIFIAFIV
ncbi:MAG: succinate dehydrogenase cytochrome b subunit [Desulfosarcina sp.]|nr:succinate dehydrogenase cytochrome b subunit [Desulfobacterales bacterium]